MNALPPEPAAGPARLAELESELADLTVLYENALEHGTALEEQLLIQNTQLDALRNRMRKYLSPQLYQVLVGGSADAADKSHARVKLTVYFSDMVGFSDLTDAIEPELLSDVLNSYLTRMAEIALQHGGTVDKFIGDAMLVFFGAPEFTDDVTHAQRCVRMALEMREELYRLREDWQQKGIAHPLQVRAGINTGYCTVGNFGSENRLDYTIIGNQVNLASRLQYLAPPDNIYLAGSTYRLVEDLVEVRSVGAMQVKGIHAPVDTWELVGLKEDSALISPYLTAQDNHVQLSALDLDLEALPDAERRAILKALARAQVLLAQRHGP